MEIRSIYDGKQDEVSEMSGLSCEGDPGETKQSAKDECDINKITARYERTGALPDLIRQDARYGDFSNVPDYMTALNVVNLANEQFGALDAHVRARFDNDPSKFLAFATDKRNIGDMVKLGLATAPAPTPVDPAPAVAPGALTPGAK